MKTSSRTVKIVYATITKDLKGVILGWNRGAEKIFGYSAAEMTGSSFMRLVPPDYREIEEQINDKVRRGRTLVRFETVLQTKDGRWLCILAKATPIKDAGGNITGVSTMARDITEEKNTENLMLESARLAQATIDALPAHICVLGESGRIIAANSAWREFPELNSFSGAETQVGTNYLQACDRAEGSAREPARAFAAGIRAVFAGEKAGFEMEYACHSPAENRWFAGRVTRFPGDGVLRVVVVHENITARKQADEESDKLRQLVEHSPDFIGLADMDGKVIFLNAGGRKMIGLDEHQDLGALTFQDYVPPEWQEFFRETVLATAVQEGIWHGEMQLVNLKTGALVDVNRTIFVINDTSANKRFFASVTRDVTQRKQVENELRLKSTFLEAQVNSSPDAILVVDAKKRKVLQNQRLIELFHVPADIAENPNDGRLLQYALGLVKHPEKFLERVQWLYAHPDETGLDEIELLEGKIVERYSSPIRDEAGKYHGRIWALRDITERKRAEAAIHSQLNELQRWHEAMLDREDRIMALKREVNELHARLKLPARYHLPTNQ